MTQRQIQLAASSGQKNVCVYSVSMCVTSQISCSILTLQASSLALYKVVICQVVMDMTQQVDVKQ